MATTQPKIMILIRKKPGMSREEFIEYYESSHVELAKRLFGHLMVRYVRNYPLALVKNHPEDYDLEAAYDAITEITVRDEAAMEEFQRIHMIPENVAAIIADEEQFQIRSETRLLLSEPVDTGVTVLETETRHPHLSLPPHSGV